MGLFSGPKTTTNTSQQEQSTSLNQGSQTGINSSQFSNTTTPNLPAWYSTFLSSLPGQYKSLAQTLTQSTQHPLYGPQQQAAFQGNLNQNQNQLHQQLLSSLASRGALNSGRSAQEETQLGLGGQQQLSNYLAQVPQLNAQNQLQNTGQLNSLLANQAGFTSPVTAFGSTQSGQQQSLSDLLTKAMSQSNSSSTGQTNSYTTPNILGGLAGGAINAGLGALLK